MVHYIRKRAVLWPRFSLARACCEPNPFTSLDLGRRAEKFFWNDNYFTGFGTALITQRISQLCCSAVCWYFNRPIACCCAPPIVRHKRVQFVCVSWKLTGNFNEKPIFLLRMRQNAFGSLCRRSLTERKQSGAVVLGSSSLLNFVLCNINCASPCSKDTCFVCNGVCIGFGTTNPSIVIAC